MKLDKEKAPDFAHHRLFGQTPGTLPIHRPYFIARKQLVFARST